jgi:flagellar motor switch protein FliM
MVLVSTFSVAAPGELEPGELCVCIPFISLDGVLTRLGNSFRFASMKRDQTQEQVRYLRRVVDTTPLTVTATLGTTTLSVGEILGLKAGDVLVLDQRTETPARGLVKGELRFLGRAGKLGRKAGFLIETVCPDGREPL